MPETRFRLIMMDLDGTLLDDRSHVRPRTRETLRRAHAAGVSVAVATGRSYALARYFCGDLPLSGMQITYNGAIVVDSETGRPTYLQAVPAAMIRPVLDFMQQQDLFACYFTEDAMYVHDHSTLERALVPSDFPQPIAVPDLRELVHLPCLKLVAVAKEEQIERIRLLAEAAFGDTLYVTQTASVLLEFLHPAVSKGAALSRIISSLRLDPAQVIAFGDSHNDIGMLQVAGTGVAMGNASAEVRAVADLVAPANTEDGIAVVLDDLLWT